MAFRQTVSTADKPYDCAGATIAILPGLFSGEDAGVTRDIESSWLCHDEIQYGTALDSRTSASPGIRLVLNLF